MTRFGVEDVLFLDRIAAGRSDVVHQFEDDQLLYKQFLQRIENPNDFADAMTVLDDRRGGMIASFGGLLATDAVRNRAPDDIRLGLVANALDYMVTKDWRDHMYTLARLARACEFLDRDVAEEFLRAAEIVGSTVGQSGKADDWLLAFASRTPENRSLAAFGQVEEGIGRTFRFRRVDELLTNLVQVIPVLQRETANGITATIISIERYSDAFVVLFSVVIDRKKMRGTLNYPWNSATDDHGRKYIRSARLSGPSMFHGNPNLQRGGVLYTPAIRRNVQWLRMELPTIESTDRIGSGATGKSVTSDLAAGPWAFTIGIPPLDNVTR
jgi:hypothetical protein